MMDRWSEKWFIDARQRMPGECTNLEHTPPMNRVHECELATK